MYLLPGSSEHLTRQTELSAEVKEKLDLLSIDEPLPAAPPRDLVRLLVQSPYKLHFYWNFRVNPFQVARRFFGDTTQNINLTVRLRDLTGNDSTSSEIPGFTRDYWFNALPARTYQAEVGLSTANRPFIRLLVSDCVTTPRVGTSPDVDSTDFAVAPAEFVRVLDRAGFVVDSFDIALRIADEHAPGALLENLRNNVNLTEEVPLLNLSEVEELRRVAASLAAGKLFDEIIATLSPRLARWLAGVGHTDRTRILAALRSATATAADAQIQVRDAGGSLTSAPGDFNRYWLPSMNARD